MFNDDLFNDDYLFDLQNSEKYRIIREKANEYLDKCLSQDDFISTYEWHMLNCMLYFGESDTVKVEKHFLWYLTTELDKLLDEIIDTGNLYHKALNDTIVKRYSVYHKLQKLLTILNNKDELKKLIEITNNKEIRPSSNLLVQGKRLNISERYKIANDIFDIYDTIKKKNISATEKHILLAHVIGCSEQVARELFNGTQQKRTKVREDLLTKYLKKLK